jgi:hypothetical protein
MVLDKTARKRGASLHKQAQEEGCSHIKIDSNEKFAKGIDAIKEVAPDLADKILKPKPEGPRLSKTQENINHTPDRTGMAA